MCTLLLTPRRNRATDCLKRLLYIRRAPFYRTDSLQGEEAAAIKGIKGESQVNAGGNKNGVFESWMIWSTGHMRNVRWELLILFNFKIQNRKK